MKFKTPYNAHEFKTQMERNHLPSLTIPDQSFTIKEILDRFARGLSFNGAKVPVYNGEEEIPNVARMDLADIEDMKAAIQSEIDFKKEELRKTVPRKEEVQEAEVVKTTQKKQPKAKAKDDTEAEAEQ